MRYLLMLCLIFSVLPGCAQQKLTPEEIAAERTRQLAMITRVYPDKKPEEILLAADRIFRLADDDYTVSHGPTALQAQRPWMMYMVISAASGTDTWVVETTPEGNGTKVMARHSGQSSSMMVSPVVTSSGSAGFGAGTTMPIQNMTTKPAIYQLFFARLDYFMGKQADWPTCRDADKMYTDGDLFPFCTVANDRTPDGKSSMQRREAEDKAKPSGGVSIGG